MGTIKQYFQHAELAQAAYATFSSTGVIAADNLTDDEVGAGMSSAQAEKFAATWKVVDQYIAPSVGGLTGSGFSATIFQNISTGEYVLAVRGTEPSQMNDLLDADILLGIGGQGIALRQAIDLYNYRKSLEVPLGQAYQAVYTQIDPIETAMLAGIQLLPDPTGILYENYCELLERKGCWIDAGVVFKLAMGTSTSVLAGTGLETGRQPAGLDLSNGYDVAGHSLGGHLSMVLGRLDSNNVEDVTTFNPPYFDPNIIGAPLFKSHFSRQNSERFFEEIKKLESAVYGSSDIASNFKNSQNFEISNDKVNKIGARRPGTAHAFFSEGDSNTLPVSAHSMVLISDAFAVAAVFAQLDPSLDSDPDGLTKITA
ncbi:MAG: hypothetical protein LBL72_01230, partial [Candidatus Accumulibacter sp.]|nr:hypothetical protein [Accumulibacter sp.]